MASVGVRVTVSTEDNLFINYQYVYIFIRSKTNRMNTVGIIDAAYCIVSSYLLLVTVTTILVLGIGQYLPVLVSGDTFIGYDAQYRFLCCSDSSQFHPLDNHLDACSAAVTSR